MKKTHYFFYVAFSLLCAVMNAQVNMSNTTTTVNTSTLFYDDAGGSANYSSGLNLTQVFTTNLPNHRIKVIFASLFTQNAGDSLTIYNGTTPAPANFLAKYFGSPTPATHYSTGNSMTFRFVSDATGNAAGWASTVSPFGISSITQTTSPQSSITTFNINGFNTDLNAGITGVYLVHSVSGASLAVTTYSPISATQLQVTFQIPCNADLGLYDLRVIQPVQGLTVLPNAFNVTPYDVALTGTNILCAFYNTGAITSTVTGGTPSYTYSYSPGSTTTANASGLTAGTYTLAVTDANACVRTKTITLTQPPSLSNGYPGSQTICSGQSAVLTMTASGGVPAYTYTWTGPNLSSTNTASTLASPLSSTTYTYSVQDANGCVSTSTLIVNVNNATPISITANPNQVCQGASSNLSASGASTSYTWNTGATGNSTTVSPASTTVYSVTGTASNGCTKTETVTVTVNANPVASAATATPVCLGGNLSFINNSTGAGTYSWAGPSAYASTASAPVIPNATYAQNGTYTLSALNAATGCMSSTTLAVTVNALPTLTLSAGSSSVCAGSNFTANATGASSYTWMPGSVPGASTSFTPAASTTYTASGTNANGCVGSNTLAITVNPLTAFNGTVTAASAAVSGSVTLYAYEPFLTKFDSVTTQALNGAGAYSFASVPSGSYIVKATPIAATLQVTYGNSAVGWKNANVTSHHCINSSTQNIAVQPFLSVGTGPGSLSGKIVEGQGFGQRPASAYSPLAPGTPIGGIVVKGGKNPGGNMFAQTVTGTNGTYTLSGLPNNAAGEEYFILVDIPGLDTNGTYHRVIATGSNTYTNLDFTVDSAKVNPTPTATGVKTLSGIDRRISVYPNPAKNSAVIVYDVSEHCAVSIGLFDMVGKKTRAFAQNTDHQQGRYSLTLDLKELNPGIYFLKVTGGGYETVSKLVIQD